MILYHASDLEIKKPDTVHSRKNLDFGCGFYTTPLREQAEKWCEKFIRRGNNGIISCYYLDDSALENCLKLEFPDYSEAWLDFVTGCRMGKDTAEYDIIIGGVANDKVFNTCELYFKQYIDKNTALDRLRYEKPNCQICFKKQEVINKYLHFERSELL